MPDLKHDLVVLGYLKKIGPMFLTSLITLVVSILKLTKDFWYSIPWYIYILALGSGLIVFAIKNELNDNAQNKKIGKSIKELIKNIDI